MTSACYYVSPSMTMKADWANARIACQMEGGDLAVIHTQEENDFILGKDSSKSLYKYFVGLAIPDAPPIGNIFFEMIWIGARCDTGCGLGVFWNPANYMNIDNTPVYFSYRNMRK